MSVNKQLINNVLNFLKSHPEKHDQNAWCGTRMCFAGWTCYFAGFKPLPKDHADAFDEAHYSEVSFNGHDLVANGQTLGTAEDVAKSLLGLTGEQADRLFYSGSRNDLFLVVAELLGE